MFKNIDNPNIGRLRRTIDTFLKGLWLSGALKGLVKEDAFIIDLSSLNTEETEAAGEFFGRIGLATKKAAEFVFFEFTKKRTEV